MHRIRPLLVTLTILTGCTATHTSQWHPQTEGEMRQVIGETVFMAMEQYENYLRAIGKLTLQDSLKGQDDADKPTN